MALPILDLLMQLVYRFWDIFSAPVKHPDMLWIVIPIYLSWLVGDYFQERKQTDFGNAMTNSVVILWVGLDWARQTVKAIGLDAAFATKLAICIIFIIYGLIIMVETARAKPIAHWIGRAREIGYFSVVATPIFYGVVAVDWMTIGAILVFFPVVYGINGLWDKLLPAPPGEEEQFGKSPDLDSQMPSADLGMPATPQMPQQNVQQQYPQNYQQNYPQNYGQQYPPIGRQGF